MNNIVMHDLNLRGAITYSRNAVLGVLMAAGISKDTAIYCIFINCLM